MFPFNAEPDLPQDLRDAIERIASSEQACRAHREERLHHWHRRSQVLLPETLCRIDRVRDPHLRRYLLRDVPPGAVPKVDQVPHLALWEEAIQSINHPDVHTVDGMTNGFPLNGSVQRGFSWPLMEPPLNPFHPPDELSYRVWGIRQRVRAKLDRSFQHQEGQLSKAVWDKAMSDVDLGFTTGPFDTEDEVSNFLSTSSWIAMPRLLVEQSGSVRPVDDTSPTRSSANSFAAVSERLEVPTVDLAVTIARALRGKLGNTGIGGWTVDEKSAFRQIPVAPEHRRVAVVSLCRPDSGRAVYFCMLGHPFGLTPSVYNYCRRSQSPD